MRGFFDEKRGYFAKQEAENSERGRLYPRRRAALARGRNAHGGKLRCVDDSRAGVSSEPESRNSHIRSGGICNSGGAVYYLLHRHARIQGGVSLVVRDLPYLRRGARSLAVHPVLQPDRHPAREHVHADKNTSFYPRRAADLVLGRDVLQNLSLSAGLRLFRQGRQRKVRHKAVAIQDLLRFILPRGGGDNVARVFQAL